MTPEPEQTPEVPFATLLERRLSMQLAVARALTSSSSLNEASTDLLRAIAGAEGYDAAALWIADATTSEIRCEAFFSDPARPAPELERISRRTWLPKGELLPGKVWSTGESIALDDIGRAPGFHRAFWASKDGFKAVIAFPIVAGTEVVGVIELFARVPRNPDPMFAEMMSSVSGQIGRFLRQRAAEQALLQAEERLRRVLDHAPIVLFAMDREGKLTLSEGSGLQGLGFSPKEAVGRSALDIYRDSPESLAQLRRALGGESFTCTAHLPHLGRSYETRYTAVLGDDGQLVEVIGVAIDVSERARAEAALHVSESRLVEADRLASLGTLAAGVAHEINNPLSYVILNLDQAVREVQNLDRAPPELVPSLRASIEPRLHEARQGLDRVQLIVQDLRVFSRVGSDERESVALDAVLDETLDLCVAELRTRAAVVRDYRRAPPAIGNRQRLGQVFLNLLLNAAQAIPEGRAEEHRILVRVEEDEAGRPVASITDDGEGIPPDLLGKIFEPFFTTKPPGVGTGLGLSICHGIITDLGGEIGVESRLGQGATFRVTLPAAGTAPEPRPGRAFDERSRPSPLPVAPVPPARKRVLVIDDEPVLAQALGRALEPEFDVTVLSSGREARRVLVEGTPFDVILCDLIMPEVTGMDLHEDLRASRPELCERMIFMTGGTFTARARTFLAGVNNPVLEKPFDLDTLSAVLRARAEHG
ncbi:MAG: ATP-binding protein [Byssovorax sp.]